VICTRNVLNSLRKIKVLIAQFLMSPKTSRDWCHSRQDYLLRETGIDEHLHLNATDTSTSTHLCSTQRWFLGLYSSLSLGDGHLSKSEDTIMSALKIMENVEIHSTTSYHQWKFHNLNSGTDLLEE